MLPTKFQFSETGDCSLFKNIKGLVYNVSCYNVSCYLRDRTLLILSTQINLNIKNKDYTIKKHENWYVNHQSSNEQICLLNWTHTLHNEMKLDLGLFKLDYKRSCDFVTLPGQDSCCLF